MIFETERLIFRKLEESDLDNMHYLMSDPAIVELVPQPPFTREESAARLTWLISQFAENGDKRIYAVLQKDADGTPFLGIGGFLRNDEGHEEIAYRVKEMFWGVGYGTEIAKGLIEFGFTEQHMELITADVNTVNTPSVKILDKCLNRIREFYNERDQCTDRRYAISKEDWNDRVERNEY